MTSNNKLKVLFILPTLHAGGAENYALRFIQYCQLEPMTFHVLSPNPEKGDLHDNFSNEGCSIHYQSLSYINPLKFHQFFTLLRREQFDAVVTFNGNFGGMPLTLARLAGVPKRIAWHRRSTNAFGTNPLKLFYNRFVNQLVRLNATSILSNSKYALDTFYKDYWKEDKRFDIIRNGLDITIYQNNISKREARTELGIPENVFLVGHVGRFDKSKNHKAIFRVAAFLQDSQPNCMFLFAGKGTDSISFSEQLDDYGIQPISKPLGLVGDVPLLYKAMDLFLFPSVTEGQPNALLEAMVSGVPVVTSNIQPILEVLPKNLGAKMPSPTDQNSLNSLVLELILDSSKRMGFVCKNNGVQHFDGRVNFILFLNKLNEKV